MNKPSFSISVAGRDVSSRFLPMLISASITKSTNEAAQLAEILLDDKGAQARFPRTGDPVSIEIGWEGGAAAHFEGEVDTASWTLDRGSGAVLTIRARSVSLKGKAKEPTERHWENETLGKILDDAAGEAGLSIAVHADLASRQLAYEAQDNESFMAFADRLAREHGATFAIQGMRAGFVPRNAGVSVSGAPLPTITVSRGLNLIAASGLVPCTDRPRYRAKRGRWYDIDKAKVMVEEIETREDVDPAYTLRMMQPDAEMAKFRAESARTDGESEKGGGSVTLDGTPEAELECKARLVNVRPGVDGEYIVEEVSHHLDRSSGFTTELTLRRPDAAADDR